MDRTRSKEGSQGKGDYSLRFEEQTDYRVKQILFRTRGRAKGGKKFRSTEAEKKRRQKGGLQTARN